MDRPFFPFPDKDLQCIEACAQLCFDAVPRTGTTRPAAPRLWTSVPLCWNFPQGYPLTGPKIWANSPFPGRGIHCPILEQSVVFPLKTTTWQLSTEQCLSCSQRYPGFVGKTPCCSAQRLLLEKAVGSSKGAGDAQLMKARKSQKKRSERCSVPISHFHRPDQAWAKEVWSRGPAHCFRFMTRT